MANMIKMSSNDIKFSLNTTIQEYLASLSAATRQTIAEDVQKLLDRTAELGTLSLAGDPLATETLKDMQSQALLLIGIKADEEANRALNMVRLILSVVIRALIGAALSALPA